MWELIILERKSVCVNGPKVVKINVTAGLLEINIVKMTIDLVTGIFMKGNMYSIYIVRQTYVRAKRGTGHCFANKLP